MPHEITMYLPRTDGTRQVFCEMALRKHRPCDGRVTLNAENEVMVGYMVYAHQKRTPVPLCSETCLAAYARRKD